jgi:hypothetical protein
LEGPPREQLDDELEDSLLAHGIVRLPDERDGTGSPLRALRVPAASREDALDRVMAVFDERGASYSYFAVSRIRGRAK